jgi:hypothetical protein
VASVPLRRAGPVERQRARIVSDDSAPTAPTFVPVGAADGPRLGNDATLVDLIDRVLETGVTISGDVVLSVAGVDLVYLGLRLVLKGIEGDETLP